MACSCSRSKSSLNIDDSEFTGAYGSALENERNFLSNPNSENEEANCDDVLPRDENTSTEMIFVDGNDEDLELSKYEETLIERVWWSCKPPKIPRSTHVVPARRIQVMTERLSPTVPGLPTVKQPPSREVTKNGNRRHKMKSDVNYVAINDFEAEGQPSCQTETVTIVPDCARRLEDLL